MKDDRFIHYFNKKLEIGKPIHSRIEAFKKYFLKRGFIDNFELNKNINYIFYSMPPFSNFNIFFNSKRNIILDIRDGWSISQASGYGNTTKKKFIKSFITKQLEKFIINRSYLTIACTPGLVKYLENISNKKIIFIPNGISEERINLIKELKEELNSDKKKSGLSFVCAGKFSEYGKDKVKTVLQTISNRYSNESLKVLLIGSDIQENLWTIDYFREITNGKGLIEILPRMEEKQLLKFMINANYGLSIVRNPDYELGTKVYDYIALGLPIVNYFNEPNNFTKYFDACLDVSFGKNTKIPEINRTKLIENALKNVSF